MKEEIKIEMDSELMETAERELNKIGLTLEQYMDLAARQLLIQGKIPFEIKLESSDSAIDPNDEYWKKFKELLDYSMKRDKESMEFLKDK